MHVPRCAFARLLGPQIAMITGQGKGREVPEIQARYPSSWFRCKTREKAAQRGRDSHGCTSWWSTSTSAAQREPRWNRFTRRPCARISRCLLPGILNQTRAFLPSLSITIRGIVIDPSLSLTYTHSSTYSAGELIPFDGLFCCNDKDTVKGRRMIELKVLDIFGSERIYWLFQYENSDTFGEKETVDLQLRTFVWKRVNRFFSWLSKPTEFLCGVDQKLFSQLKQFVRLCIHMKRNVWLDRSNVWWNVNSSYQSSVPVNSNVAEMNLLDSIATLLDLIFELSKQYVWSV